MAKNRSPKTRQGRREERGKLKLLARIEEEGETKEVVRPSQEVSDLHLHAGATGNCTRQNQNRIIVNPQELRNTHDKISRMFTCGRSVETLIRQIREGELSPGDLPPMEIVKWNGKLYSQSNRRCYAFKMAGVTEVEAVLVDPSKHFFDGLTTRSHGMDVKFNGIDPSGPFPCRWCNEVIDSWPELKKHERKCRKLVETGNEISEDVPVPVETLGRIIGKGGSALAGVEKLSGVISIRIRGAGSPDDDGTFAEHLRNLRIRGLSGKVEHAKSLINAIVALARTSRCSFQCLYCGKKHRSEEDEIKHEEACRRNVQAKAKQARRADSQHDKGQRCEKREFAHVCPDCQSGFRTSSAAIRHKQQCMQKSYEFDQDRYCCQYCFKEFHHRKAQLKHEGFCSMRSSVRTRAFYDDVPAGLVLNPPKQVDSHVGSVRYHPLQVNLHLEGVCHKVAPSFMLRAEQIASFNLEFFLQKVKKVQLQLGLRRPPSASAMSLRPLFATDDSLEANESIEVWIKHAASVGGATDVHITLSSQSPCRKPVPNPTCRMNISIEAWLGVSCEHDFTEVADGHGPKRLESNTFQGGGSYEACRFCAEYFPCHRAKSGHELECKNNPWSCALGDKVSQQTWQRRVVRAKIQIASLPTKLPKVTFASSACLPLFACTPPGIVCSAPSIMVDASHCFPENTKVLLCNGMTKNISELAEGDVLWSGSAKVPSQVRKVERLPEVDRDFVVIHYGSSKGSSLETVMITSDHFLKVKQTGVTSFTKVKAGESKRGDYLQTLLMQTPILDVQRRTQHGSVIEIELTSTLATMFIASPLTSSKHVFLEVFGAAWTDESSISILRFRRFNGFREALLDGDLLKPCREALSQVSVKTDLVSHGLGPGKLLVKQDQAWPAIYALTRLVKKRGRPLMQSEVVLTHCLEPLVMEAIEQASKRFNPVVQRTPLDLNPHFCVKKTFLEPDEDEARQDVRSRATNSTTEAHGNSMCNPRLALAKM